jgi:hypothetical protein
MASDPVPKRTNALVRAMQRLSADLATSVATDADLRFAQRRRVSGAKAHIPTLRLARWKGFDKPGLAFR